MSDQPDTPPLTRKKLRELRQTGAIPIIVPSEGAEPAPRPEPVELLPDSEVDLSVAPASRREARQHERIRTSAIPIITGEEAAAHAAAVHDEVHDEGAPDEETHDDEADSVIELAVVADDHSHDVHADAVEIEGEEEVEPLVVNTSFDELLSRSTSGSAGSPNALIVSTDTGAAAIVAPVTATGEVLVTGSLDLPAGLGSLGHAPGATDGKDVDDALIDGELPEHASPSPVAASAAVSTLKNHGEIVTPPAPEKSNKLMLVLAITAGVLAAALLTVLVVAMTTGLF